ncbi:MAG: pyruvate kinase [Gammaproteobacteria bacterium]|nr:pyruvate kinase [Gammaproteobacteria bacterium]
MRRTKIIATLGPSTDQPGMLERLVNCGVDLFRINYSHQSHADHERRFQAARSLKGMGAEIGIIADLQGPKIRLERFLTDKVYLEDNSSFTLDTSLDKNAGDRSHVGVTYKNLTREVSAGDRLLVDDGRIVLEVKDIEGNEVHCRVVMGGELSGKKGINLQGGGLAAGALTRKDQNDLAHAVAHGADYLAVSFVRSVDDIREARRLLSAAGSSAGIIAKLERAEALKNAEAIVEASDAIMIARGDLGVEIGDAALPPVQKRLIKMARDMDRAVITATQMMESMIDHQIPLRAEIFDVANAVFDGTDALMLSGETSVGKYPDKVVQTMARVCEETEKQRVTRVSDHRINQRFERIDEAIAMSAMYAANHVGAKAIAALTETGSTTLWMSRISSGIPVFAFTRHMDTMRRVHLYRGVYPIHFDITHTDPLQANAQIVDELMRRKIVHPNDYVIITKGDLSGHRGGTNNMKIVQAGQDTGSTA